MSPLKKDNHLTDNTGSENFEAYMRLKAVKGSFVAPLFLLWTAPRR